MIRSVATLLTLLMFAGCAAVKGQEQPVILRLSPAPLPAAPALLPAALAVAPVQARGLAGALRYDYVDAVAPSEIRQARTLFWEEPPPRVLERALVTSLRSRFATVTGSAVPGSGVRRVFADLERFEEAGAGGDAGAVIAFDVTVTGAPVLIGRYCARAPIADASGTSRAHAFEAVIAASTSRFTQDLAAGALSSSSCANSS